MELSVLKKMLIGGAKKILDNKQQLNDMNVFPIPDGDTGTNMDKTMSGNSVIGLKFGKDAAFIEYGYSADGLDVLFYRCCEMLLGKAVWTDT